MKCDFCGKDIAIGTEYIYVDSTGKPIHFCSSKCEKSMLKLGRKPQYIRWTAQYRKEKAIRTKSAAPAEPKPAAKPKEAAKEEKHEAAPKHKEEHKKEHKDARKPEHKESKKPAAEEKPKTQKEKPKKGK